MPVPDQSHINRVRDALWQRSGGGASVMVGSGFSRNALKARPDANDPPTWREVAKAVYDKLYLQDGDRDAIAEASQTSDFLKLAQEYEVAFGRGELHSFIRSLIRDDDFKPGDLHTRLLRLPWRDVFTTNWDTLLERARTAVAGRAYSVVRNMDEIPQANRPRIVKLHGSLPAHFPLIFTEEDYRTYPRQFAPLVNTAQQAMMETVFCLIGFSSDDPNFLEWSGWVRDNLGKSAPKIYLAGWLNLLPHRRRMLEDRNIVPIDLALHPKASEWPEPLRHQYATEWILHTLERGVPYDVTLWPSLPSAQEHGALPTHLEPVEIVKSDTPQEEPIQLPSSSSDSVRQLLGVWAHNRKIYPGWLAVPSSEQQLLSQSTNAWEPMILQVLPDLAPIDRLNAIRELVWRKEILLEPILQLESEAEKTLKPIDCHRRTIDGVVDLTIEWAAVREAWRTVALALVTTARFRFDEDAFEKRIAALSPFRNDHPDVAQRIHHERCLWAVYSMDFEALGDLLKDWQTENCDPVWMMRKAAILSEMDQKDDAIELLNHALSAIRESPGDERSLAGPSREGWALLQTQAFEREFSGQVKKQIDAPLAFTRWRELASLKCDASTEKHWYAEAIKDSDKKNEKLPFDLGHRQEDTIHISNAEYDRQIAAYRAIRLSEVAGLPPIVNHFASDILKLAAGKLSMTDPEIAARLVLRVLNYDQDPLLTQVLSRTRVAAMPVNSVRRLTQVCNSAIEHALPHAGGPKRTIFWTERLSVVLEALSRLVLRAEPEMAETVFDKALEYYRNNHVAQHKWLAKPVQHILERSWKTLPKDRQSARVLDFLNAPIVGMDGFTASSARYPDPGWLLQDEFPLPARTSDNENRWREITSLLVRGLNAGGEARKRASARIVKIALKGLLSDNETSQVAQALWSQDHTAPDDLPGGTALYGWVFLFLPEPEPGLAEQRFRRKWLDIDNSPQRNGADLDELLSQVGHAISELKDSQYSLTLSDREQEYLACLIGQWAEAPPVRQAPFFFNNERIKWTRRAIFYLRSILLKVSIPEATATKLYEKVQALKGSDTPRLRLIAGIARALPDHFDEIALLVRMELTSDDSTSAKDAAWGLHSWLVESDSTPELCPPPDDLIREIGVIIATRRKVILGQALQTAKWVFAEGSEAQREIIGQLAIQGLGYLAEELRYDREHDLDFDVPLLRRGCAHLALAMAEQGFGDDPAVARWLEIYKEDPLPEVRYAKHPSFARQRKEEESTDDESTSQAE